MELFENPNCLPLEVLKLEIKNDGVISQISALNARWAEKRYFFHYETLEIYNDDESEIIGAKDYWIEIVNFLIKDLNWLLNLPFYRFWSNIVYNTSIINTLTSFLQEAPPFYALEKFSIIPEILEALENLSRNVLLVFARLVTNKESSTEYMSALFHGNLLYDNYIFTIPIIFDLCQLYGRENAKVIDKILHNVFTLQPSYNDDLQKSVPFLIKILKNVEQEFEDQQFNVTETMALSERRRNSIEMKLSNSEDLVLYILDISSTLVVLLKNYSPAIATFYREDFMNKIVSIYQDTIPRIYEKLDKLENNENMPKFTKLKHRLDVTKVEILNLYRIIIYQPILNIEEGLNNAVITEFEVRNSIEEYLNSLINITSEKEFIRDYHRCYSINVDFETISSFCAEIDSIKCEYILHSLYGSIEDSMVPTTTFCNNAIEAIAGPSGIQNNHLEVPRCDNINSLNNEIESISKDSDKLTDFILEVKEILCDHDEDFIRLCLEHYNYDVQSVINAVLENTFPSHLKETGNTLPNTLPNEIESSATLDLATGIQRLNISDDDDFDISRMYEGKKKERYNNIDEILNDKSEIKNCKAFYEKYSIVDDYDDEYDDMYDHHNIRSNTGDDITEIGSRPFTTRRMLRVNNKDESTSEDSTEDEKPIKSKEFISNPADIRAKIEQQRQLSKGNRNKNKYVVGDSNDQGQGKDIPAIRREKNVHKSSQSSNHRKGFQMKKRQGMIPS